MNAPEIIQTERLILRKPRMEDAPIIFEAYAQDPEVTRYLVWRPHKNVGETEAFLQRCLGVWSKGTNFPYVLTLKGKDEPIGMLEVHTKWFKLEVGYAIGALILGQRLHDRSLCAP